MDEYVQNKMKTDGSIPSYGTHVENFATASILQQSVLVYSKNGSHYAWQQFKPLCVSANVAKLLYITIANTGDYYMLIAPNKNICNCLVSKPCNIDSQENCPIDVDMKESMHKGNIAKKDEIKTKVVKDVTNNVINPSDKTSTHDGSSLFVGVEKQPSLEQSYDFNNKMKFQNTGRDH